MKVHTQAPTPPPRPWYAPEAAQINFALFPDMFMPPPPQQPAPRLHRHRHDTPQEDGLFVQFCTWLGGLVERWVGNDAR